MEGAGGDFVGWRVTQRPFWMEYRLSETRDYPPLSSGARETLRCLFFHGPTWDGDIPSKQGRRELLQAGLCYQTDGYAHLTPEGVLFAIGSGLDTQKDRWQRERRETVIIPMMRNWARISKGLSLSTRNAEIADFDDELASLLAETARQTLEWRDGTPE